LQDRRLLLTFTVRDLHPPLGVRALPGEETGDGFTFDFSGDRLMLDTKTGSRFQGGGFGPTVQLKDGTLVTSYSYRGKDGKTHLEVVRWKLPVARPAKRVGRTPSPLFEQRPLFQAGEGGYHTYRIPALAVTTRGTVLAVCEARKKSRSDLGDIDLALRRSEDGGRTWSKSEIIADDGDHTMGNPCPVVDRQTGTVWLPFCRDNRQIFVMRSDDDGKTWSRPVEITKEAKDPAWHWVGTGPGHGIQLRSGRLLVPCWAGVEADVTHGKTQLSYTILSDDAGKSWRRGKPLDRDASDECEAVELSDGSLYMTLRSRRGKRQRGYAFSKDGGETWSAVKYDPRLPGPSCQGSVARFGTDRADGKRRVLLAAPAKPDARSHMTVRMSTDDCRGWAASKLVHAGSSAYSDLAVTDGRDVLLLYESDDYSRLTLARFNLAWLTDGKGSLP
jgi:sialidase-1